GRFNEVAGRSESELRILRDEVERWRREAIDLQKGREALLNRLEMVAQEHDELAVRLDASVAAPEELEQGQGTGNGQPAGSPAVAPPPLAGIEVMSVDDVLDKLIPGVREGQGGLPGISGAGRLRNSAGPGRGCEPGRQVVVPRSAFQESGSSVP